MKKFLSWTIKIGVLVLAYLIIFSPETLGLSPKFTGGVKPIDMWRQIRNASEYSLWLLVFWLAMASGVKLVGILCGIIRWKLLLRAQGIAMPFWYMTYLWFAGRAIGMFTPGTLGLDGWRLVESARYTKEWVKCTTVIAIEKLIGFVSLTFLVFITFPFGFRLLDINPVIFGTILLVLFAFTTVCFLLLFNPRLIQILVTVIPTPGKVRNVVNRIGAAATVYSGHRGTLMLAVLFGLGVHFFTCIMVFFCMVAIRTPNTYFSDILFASPIMIYATVLTPTIKGLGARELVLSQLLGETSGFDASVTFAHLGYWTGEFVPLLLSFPLLLLGKRPSREQLDREMSELRAKTGGETPPGINLTPVQVRSYRAAIFGALLCGAFGGLFAGVAVGFIEAGWLLRSLSGLTELQMFPWGVLVYGKIFAGIGLGIGAGLVFLYLLFDRFAPGRVTLALSFFGAFVAGGAGIALFRYKRDVLESHAATMEQNLTVLASVAGAALLGAILLYIVATLARRISARPVALMAMGVLLYGVCLGVAAGVAAVAKPAEVTAAFSPAAAAKGPNIILVAVDTLRADYLKAYNAGATSDTPAMASLVGDGILFRHSYAQASWTKPSFGTIFSGLYPEQHTATTKTAALPPSVETVAELLSAGGYYTKGFANNPNVSSIFGFNQGFTDYTYLEPSLYFGAASSSSKLVIYEVLRHARQIGVSKLGRFIPSLGKIHITEFYQPAEVVTREGLAWVDAKQAPGGIPFFLYLHYMDPHDPFIDPDAPQGGYARVRNSNPDPEQFLEPMKKAYVRGINHLDTGLQQLFDGLRQRGLYDNALIVLTSDHGEEFYDHEGWWHGQTLYEELCHIPLILKLPANAQAGQVNEDIARHIDLAPTMLRFAGLEKSAAMPGQPLVSLEGLAENAGIAYSYAENDFEGNELRSVRNKDTKLIEAKDNTRALEPVELYDLSADPKEQHTLAGQPEQAALEETLKQTIETYQQVIAGTAAEPAGAVDTTELQEQLGGLGYLGTE